MTRQLVSVLLPVFNGGASIQRCVSSLLEQTYRDLEIVVVDDGSSDDTANILDRFNSERLIRIFLPTNAGIVAALNAGLPMCRGSLIARADSDDCYAPDRIEQQVRFLAANPDVGICGTHQMVFGGYSDGLNVSPLNHEEITASLLFMPTMLHPTVLIRKQVLQELKRAYDPEFHLCEDYELWVRAAQHTRLANIPHPLCSYHWDRQKSWETNRDDLISGLTRIWSTQLAALGVAPTPRVMRYHLLLAGRAVPSVREVFLLIGYVLQLVQANRQTRTYDSKSFLRVLMRNLTTAGKCCIRSRYFKARTQKAIQP